MKTLSLITVITLFSTLAYAACPSSPARFVASGADVTDNRTGLIWQRCSVGQTSSGNSCMGVASTMTHEAALVYARNNADAQGWRLPDVKELSSLADKGCQNPAIDIAAYPATPSSNYWSSSPGGVGAWRVSFDYGNVYGSARNGNYSVRLVRSSQ